MADQTKTIGSGGDYSTIALWAAAADVTSGFWKGVISDNAEYLDETVDLGSGLTGTPTSANRIWLTVDAANRHSGAAGTGHARMRRTTSGHALTISASYTQVEYLEIKQDSSGVSSEGIRLASGVVDFLLSRLIIWADTNIDQQDGVYAGNYAVSGSIDNCAIYGFYRSGIFAQQHSGTGDQTWNIDNCTVTKNTGYVSQGSGGITARADDTGAVVTMNIYNTASVGNASDDDFNLDASGGDNGTVTWNGTHNADSDGSLTTVGINTSAQQNLTVVATTKSTGSWFVVNNITAGSEDYTLLDDAAGNLAYGNATNRVGSEPDSRQDFSTDIAGNTRSTSTPSPDIGASEYISAITAGITGTATASIIETDVVSGGKTIILTLTGDTWVAAGATFDAQRQNIINGLDSAQAEAAGWDAEVKAKEVVGAVVRTSDTVVTITLTAQAAYDITAQETVTATIPATALVTSASAIIAAPTFTIDFVGGATLPVFRNQYNYPQMANLLTR